jgi:hypothetical protein
MRAAPGAPFAQVDDVFAYTDIPVGLRDRIRDRGVTVVDDQHVRRTRRDRQAGRAGLLFFLRPRHLSGTGGLAARAAIG